MKKIISVHNLGEIRIREYEDTNYIDGTPQRRYFTATICGWRGFKFKSKTLLGSQLLKCTIEYCNYILECIRMNGEESVEKFCTEIYFN